MLRTFHQMMKRTRQDLRQAKDQHRREEQDDQRYPEHFQHIGDQQLPQCILAHTDANRAERTTLDRPADVLDLPEARVHAQHLRFCATRPVQLAQMQRHPLWKGMRHHTSVRVQQKDIRYKVIVSLLCVDQLLKREEIARLQRVAAELRHLCRHAQPAPLQ